MGDLDVCLGISGSFEGGNGGPRWDLLTGNFDDMGISVGCLQWNPGTGSIQTLLHRIFEKLGAVPPEFEAIGRLAEMNAPTGTAYAIKQWIRPGDVKKRLTPEAVQLWTTFLQLPASKDAQVELAQVKLDAALKEATEFMPFLQGQIDLRTAAFFFDLRVQQGGLRKKMPDGKLWAPTIITDPSKADYIPAIQAAQAAKCVKVAAAWTEAAATDNLTKALLSYAYQRALKAKSQYMWDTLARRGAIAARQGFVHGKWFDFRNILP